MFQFALLSNRRSLIGILVSTLVIFACTQADAANLTLDYGWEDQDASVFGTFGNITVDGVVTGVQPRTVASAAVTSVPGASEGDYYLKVSETPHSGTPNALIGAVYGLNPGDTIDVSLDGWDETDGASPSIRLWFAQVDAAGAFAGSAQSTFVADFGGGAAGGDWVAATGSYTFDDALDFAGGEGIGIQLRIYSTPSTSDPNLTEYFVDNLQIDVMTSGAASIALPNGTTVSVPEPTGLALALIGLVAFGLRRKN